MSGKLYAHSKSKDFLLNLKAHLVKIPELLLEKFEAFEFRSVNSVPLTLLLMPIIGSWENREKFVYLYVHITYTPTRLKSE
jgi:hypothetical protein